jgi:hypothetical protein
MMTQISKADDSNERWYYNLCHPYFNQGHQL